MPVNLLIRNTFANRGTGQHYDGVVYQQTVYLSLQSTYKSIIPTYLNNNEYDIIHTMEYRRKTFTIPSDVADKLGTEKNQSMLVVQALNNHWAYRTQMNRLAHLAKNIESTLDSVHVLLERIAAQPTKPKTVTTYRGTVVKQTPLCCIERRPDPETGLKPCKHWRRTEEGIVNVISGEIIEV